MAETTSPFDLDAIVHLITAGKLDAVVVSVCAVAETLRSHGEPVIPEGPAGAAVRTTFDQIYAALIEQQLLEEYALFFQATRYVPHGRLVQPALDLAMARFSERVRRQGRQGMSEVDKDILRIFIELSLEAYDKLGSFRVFLQEFREFIPFALLPKAIQIARNLGDDVALRELTANLLHPPAEIDESWTGDS